MYHADVTSQMLQWFRVIFETEKKNVLGALEKHVGVYSFKRRTFSFLTELYRWDYSLHLYGCTFYIYENNQQ